ncbi:retrovirus-related pol polyprotein from transposon TNT 1-94 [Tanacetum coccineum]
MDGNVNTFKARLVAKGFTQTYDVDYGETFYPVVDIRAIRILLAISAFYDYKIWQMDVKTAFLNGYLSEDVYMVQPEGFVDPEHPNKVCKLQRSIYGLKQASRSSILYVVRCTRPDVAFAQNLCSRFQQNLAVNWKSAKQSTTAMSSTEAEYIALAKASIKAVWMRKFIDGLRDVMPSNKRHIEMLCDNEPALAIANDNVADTFIKPVPLNKHFEHAMAIGIVPVSSLMLICYLDNDFQHKLVAITVYKGTDKRNFDVHKPFKFGDFGITELDELQEIIPKRKNKVVKDLMNSLSKKYERLRATHEELGIRPSLPVPGQVLFLTSGRKRKHQELEPETRIPGLECNRSLPKGVPFVNNLVIKHLVNVLFFIDFFGDEAFQRMNDIHKVDVDTLLTYLMMASNVSTPTNQRFCLALRSLIYNHPDKEKLKSKKVKLEDVGYSLI